MKRILLFTTILLASLTQVNAQCAPDLSIDTPGLTPIDTNLACIIRNTPYSEVVQFKNFDQVDGAALGFPGITMTIILVEITSISNLPNGITLECNTGATCEYGNDENGCLLISGTTTDPAGTYNLGFNANVTVDLGGGPFGPLPLDSGQLAAAGLSYALTIIDQGDTCENTGLIAGVYSAAISGDNSVCEGETTVLTANASGGDAPYTYSWSPTTGLDDASIQAPTATPTANTTYTVVVTDNNGATTDASMMVTVNALPTIDAAGDTTICEGSSAPLTASGGDTYDWSPSAGLDNASSATPMATPAATATYTVVGTDANGCSSSDDVMVTVEVCSGISDLVNNNLFKLYPNPSNGAFTVNFSAIASGSAVGIEMINAAGEVVMAEQIKVAQTGSTQNFDASDMPKGVYMIRLSTDNKIGMQKLVIR